MRLMQTLEEMEEKSGHVATADYCMQMITCEEAVDISYFDQTNLEQEHCRKQLFAQMFVEYGSIWTSD